MIKRSSLIRFFQQIDKHMKLKFQFLFLISFLLSHAALAQKKKNSLKESYSITISDNVNLQYQEYNYHFWNDSLVITGLSDFGRSHVSYLRRKLEKEERKKITDFIFQLHADSLDTAYFHEFASFGYISADHFPRVINLEIRYHGKVVNSKITNCYVRKVATLFEFLNQFYSKEVHILYRENDFKASF